MSAKIKRNNDDGTRLCRQCNKNTLLSGFRKSSKNWEGYEEKCKECKKTILAEMKQQNPDMYKEYYVKNKDLILARNKIYQDKNRDAIYKNKKIKKLANPNKDKDYRRAYYLKNREKVLASQKKYLDAKKASGGFILKEGQISCWHRNGEYNRKKKKERYAELIKDPLFRLKHRIRGRVTTAFTRRGWKKSDELQKIVGADFEFVKNHIERKFTKDMTWENYGDWHIDHIIPLSSAKNKEDLISLCHYTNLQPLWAFDNLSKGAKIPNVQMKIAI